MNILLDNDTSLLIFGFLIQFTSIFFIFLKKNKSAVFFSNTINIIGLAFSLFISIKFLFTSNGNTFPLFYNFVKIDTLSLFFLFLIQLISIPTSIYIFSYLKHYIDEKRNVRSFMLFFILLIISSQMIVIANHAILFLICWEMMSMTGFLGMLLEYEKNEVQKGSFYYFAASHVIVFILYIMFFILHKLTGSWFFDEYQKNLQIIYPVTIFLLGFLGFGIKAGFIPFHFWLPQAHPIAPTVLSAFLSGVIIKLGIYGIFRTYLFLKPLPEWVGWLVIIISLVSAIFGVWYALAQHDIKKLLAYHSVENIGIIGIGFGLGLIGAANNSLPVQILGFGGALLHTLNHAIFKSLLFIGSGVIYQNLGTRNIEEMGGIVHRAKYLSIFFLIGSIAISGLPPFNGFISEFIIYVGFFKTANELKNYYPILMLLFAVGLALVGGLAVACFTKVNSIIFLGTARKEIKKFVINIYDYISLGLLSSLCIIIGFFPTPFVYLIGKIIKYDFVNYSYRSVLETIEWNNFSFIFISFSSLATIIFFIKKYFNKKYSSRKIEAWGCGYNNITPRMQYTASSFADELNEIPKSILLYHKKIDLSENVFPKSFHFESHSDDLVDSKVVIPFFNNLRNILDKIQFLSQTDIRYYIGFILITIFIYSLLSFIWN